MEIIKYKMRVIPKQHEIFQLHVDQFFGIVSGRSPFGTSRMTRSVRRQRLKICFFVILALPWVW